MYMSRRGTKRKHVECYCDAPSPKKSKIHHTNLLEMPTEILHHIIGMLRVRQRCHARRVCRRLRDIVDRELHTDLCRIADTSFGVRAVCNAVSQLTLILDQTPLNSFLPGALFALWHSSYPHEPRLVRIEQFVVTTYEEMHRALGRREFQVVFVATVLSFLRRRELAQCRRAYWDCNNAELNYTMPKCWLGILHACRPASRSFEFPQDGAVLWLFLLRMLMITQLGCLRSDIFDGESKLFAYGRYERHPARGIDFSIHLEASSTCIQALRQIADNDDDQLVSAVGLLTTASIERFECSIEMSCKEAQMRGCPCEYFVEIGP